jgi:hypothetical protein
MNYHEHETYSTSEGKRAFLHDFMTTRAPPDMPRVDAIQYSFLFLCGERDTGTISIVESVAQEVFGENWKRHVYLRIDDGQQYPYKLHGNKVATSDKVIFISTDDRHLGKWLDMYRASRRVRFVERHGELLPLRQRLLAMIEDIHTNGGNVNDLVHLVNQIPANLP